MTERKDDIPLLVNFQLKKLSREMTKEVRSVSKEVMELLMGYDWPGNVQELNNVLEHAMNICQGDTLKLEHFDSFVSRVLEKRVPWIFRRSLRWSRFVPTRRQRRFGGLWS